jgi:hypothetical protein
MREKGGGGRERCTGTGGIGRTAKGLSHEKDILLKIQDFLYVR